MHSSRREKPASKLSLNNQPIHSALYRTSGKSRGRDQSLKLSFICSAPHTPDPCIPCLANGLSVRCKRGKGRRRIKQQFRPFAAAPTQPQQSAARTHPIAASHRSLPRKCPSAIAGGRSARVLRARSSPAFSPSGAIGVPSPPGLLAGGSRLFVAPQVRPSGAERVTHSSRRVPGEQTEKAEAEPQPTASISALQPHGALGLGLKRRKT